MIEHRWDLSPSEAIELQRKLARKVRVAHLKGPIRTVAGTDCAFVEGAKRVLGAAVLCDADSMEVLSSAWAVRSSRMPYIPGLLSFREGPAVIAALSKLPVRADLLLCDGQGVAHPRGLGLASHVGLWVGIPTIGVAKSRLCGTAPQPAASRGSRRQLRLDRKVIGVVLRTRTGVNPLYVSVGHRVTLDDAIRWTLRCTRGVRIPEPTRRAHHCVTALKTTRFAT